MNSDFDTDTVQVVTCPGEGAPHPLKVPRGLPSNRRLICLFCDRDFSASEARNFVVERDKAERSGGR